MESNLLFFINVDVDHRLIFCEVYEMGQKLMVNSLLNVVILNDRKVIRTFR